MARAAASIEEPQLPGMPDELPPDPEPGTPRRRRAPTKATKAPAKRTGTRGRIAARTASGSIKSKAQMVGEVREQIEFFINLSAGGWSMRDPVCAASVSEERAAAMSKHLTNMLARNDRLLAYAANSGIIGDIVGLLHAAVPIIREVASHHGPGGDRHGQAPHPLQDPEHLDAQYPAFSR